MDRTELDQELIFVLVENKIISSMSTPTQRDEAIISLVKTLKSNGYNSSEIVELIDNKMNLLDILEFHRDLVLNEQYECCCLVNKLKKMIKQIKEENHGIYN